MNLRRLWTGRWLDLLAVAAVLFVAYKLLVAPRFLSSAGALPAPRVTYAMLSGENFVLAQHRGRVVFLDFWASWCEPCKLSLPLVERFARAHPNVDVVPVDVGEPKAIVQAFSRRYGLRNVALDPKTLSQGFFRIEGFPTMVVIDPQGRIRATWSGFNPAIQANMAHAERVLANAS